MISTRITLAIFLAILLLIGSAQIVSADLPPRPVPPTATAGLPKQHTEGAKLVLILSTDHELMVSNQSWTQVQWQDASGQWHDVNGWAGSPTYNEKQGYFEVEWWVGKEQFAAGPFRWAIQKDQLASRKMYTTHFYLPTKPNEVKKIEF